MDFSTFGGVVPAVATPLNADESFDEAGFRKLLRYMLDAGVHGLFINGSTGEAPSLPDSVRHRVLEIALDENAGKVPILAGVFDACVKTTEEHIRHAVSAGADAVVAASPFYFKLNNQEHILDYFKHLTEVSTAPVFVYNVPQAVKTFIEASSILEMSRWEKIAGIKDSSTEFNHFQKIVSQSSDNQRFRIFQGSEFQFASSIFMGAHGGVLGIGNVAPGLCVQVYEAAKSGNVEKARELQVKLTDISQVFWMGETPMTGLKAAISALGLCGPTTARPMPQASKETIRKLDAYVKERQSWIQI